MVWLWQALGRGNRGAEGHVPPDWGAFTPCVWRREERWGAESRRLSGCLCAKAAGARARIVRSRMRCGTRGQAFFGSAPRSGCERDDTGRKGVMVEMACL